ncbi:hypothetical protein AAFF_G00413860 [Aldrovandia affinis]|uniref:Uncharacterized protein n=1 Tax=Aldrovandia affinis TaxID=143900 RepID=A0AAD7SBM8_9TELE|nr:hypothetical protein AAFF_G00413860 [Aldrovandia affinis]
MDGPGARGRKGGAGEAFPRGRGRWPRTLARLANGHVEVLPTEHGNRGRSSAWAEHSPPATHEHPAPIEAAAALHPPRSGARADHRASGNSAAFRLDALVREEGRHKSPGQICQQQDTFTCPV